MNVNRAMLLQGNCVMQRAFLMPNDTSCFFALGSERSRPLSTGLANIVPLSKSRLNVKLKINK